MTSTAKQVAIFGANSAIARAAAMLWADRGYGLWLCGRDPEKLKATQADLEARNTSVSICQADLDDLDQHPGLIEQMQAACPNLDMVLFAHGILGDAALCRQDWTAAHAVLHTNFTSICSLLTHVANIFESHQHGVIGVISSVAGDRGRQSNYVYGASKAGLDAFASGLRNRLFASGVALVNIKPGFVSTPMTAHLRQGLLFASPQTVAKGIVKAMAKGKHTVYLPWFWRFIMIVVRYIPEFVFKRLKL